MFHWQTVPLLLTAAAYLQQLYPAPQPHKIISKSHLLRKEIDQTLLRYPNTSEISVESVAKNPHLVGKSLYLAAFRGFKALPKESLKQIGYAAPTTKWLPRQETWNQWWYIPNCCNCLKTLLQCCQFDHLPHLQTMGEGCISTKLRNTRPAHIQQLGSAAMLSQKMEPQISINVIILANRCMEYKIMQAMHGGQPSLWKSTLVQK